MSALLVPLLPLAAGIAGALGLGLAGPRASRASRALAAAALVASFFLFLRSPAGPEASELLRRDGFSSIWSVLCLLGALPLALFMSVPEGVPEEAAAALVLGATLGALLLCAANQLFLLFLGLELMSLCSYLLVYGLRRDRDSLEAAIKYFFSGSAASALFLLGLALHYSQGRSLSLAPGTEPGPAPSLSFALMGGAALFKIGAFPLHFWLPDAYEGSTPELAGFFSTAVKSAAFLFLLRLLSLFPSPCLPDLKLLLPWLAAATMAFGNLLALRQERLQRLLAYSSMAHAGYLLAATWAWTRLGGDARTASTLALYLAAYLFTSSGAFLFLRFSGLRTVRGLRGLAFSRPALASFFALMLLSLAGLPPTAGFLAKFFVFWDLLRAEGAWLAVALALNSLVALGYYFRLIQEMFLSPSEPGQAASFELSLPARLSLALCAAGALLPGLAPGLRGWLALWMAR